MMPASTKWVLKIQMLFLPFYIYILHELGPSVRNSWVTLNMFTFSYLIYLKDLCQIKVSIMLKLSSIKYCDWL